MLIYLHLSRHPANLLMYDFIGFFRFKVCTRVDIKIFYTTNETAWEFVIGRYDVFGSFRFKQYTRVGIKISFIIGAYLIPSKQIV